MFGDISGSPGAGSSGLIRGSCIRYGDRDARDKKKVVPKISAPAIIGINRHCRNEHTECGFCMIAVRAMIAVGLSSNL